MQGFRAPGFAQLRRAVSTLAGRPSFLSSTRSRCAANSQAQRHLCSQQDKEKTRLNTVDLVNGWMDNELLVDPRQDLFLPVRLFRRSELWMSLRLLRGFDLEDFILGSSHAYGVVLTAMYTRDWETLEHLVSPACLEAMQASARRCAVLRYAV